MGEGSNEARFVLGGLDGRRIALLTGLVGLLGIVIYQEVNQSPTAAQVLAQLDSELAGLPIARGVVPAGCQRSSAPGKAFLSCSYVIERGQAEKASEHYDLVLKQNGWTICGAEARSSRSRRYCKNDWTTTLEWGASSWDAESEAFRLELSWGLPI